MSLITGLEAAAEAARTGIDVEVVDLRTLVDMLRVAGGATPYLNSRVDNIGARGAPAEFSLEETVSKIMADAGLGTSP